MTVEDKDVHRAEECVDQRNHMKNEMWNMSFNGVVSKEGVGVIVWINPPKLGSKICS